MSSRSFKAITHFLHHRHPRGTLRTSYALLVPPRLLQTFIQLLNDDRGTNLEGERPIKEAYLDRFSLLSHKGIYLRLGSEFRGRPVNQWRVIRRLSDTPTTMHWKVQPEPRSLSKVYDVSYRPADKDLILELENIDRQQVPPSISHDEVQYSTERHSGRCEHAFVRMPGEFDVKKMPVFYSLEKVIYRDLIRRLWTISPSLIELLTMDRRQKYSAGNIIVDIDIGNPKRSTLKIVQETFLNTRSGAQLQETMEKNEQDIKDFVEKQTWLDNECVETENIIDVYPDASRMYD